MEIKKKPAAVPFVDLLEGCDRWEIDVDGQHGLVALVDMMPRLVPAGTPCAAGTPGAAMTYVDDGGDPVDGEQSQQKVHYLPRTPTADGAVVQAARTSTGQGLKSEKEDTGLERYLYRHRHGTPFEMVTFKFYHVLPVFVARQLIRHRMASVNEFSARYAEVKDRFWIPKAEDLRKQGTGNKQGGDAPMNLADAMDFVKTLRDASESEMQVYRWGLGKGMSKELARVGLGLNLYTEWYWELDLRNLLQFLSLRQDKHAQKEIRDYADAMYTLIKPLVPVAIQAYDDYDANRGGLLLSSLDTDVISYCVDHRRDDEQRARKIAGVFTNNRELGEFAAKADRIGLPHLGVMARQIVDARGVETAKK